MTLLRPRIDPHPMETRDAEALIREAHRLRRRRWVGAAFMILCCVWLEACSWPLEAPADTGPRRPSGRGHDHLDLPPHPMCRHKQFLQEMGSSDVDRRISTSRTRSMAGSPAAAIWDSRHTTQRSFGQPTLEQLDPHTGTESRGTGRRLADESGPGRSCRRPFRNPERRVVLSRRHFLADQRRRNQMDQDELSGSRRCRGTDIPW